MKTYIHQFLGACLLSCGIAAALTSCKNGDADFPDYEGGTTTYFAYQYPVRTIVLGDDEYDTTGDKAGKCQIQATFGGSYSGSNGSVQIAVDPTLCDHLTFQDGTPVKVMPEDYYSLSTNTLSFGGTFKGITEVQLTEAFFSDPDAVGNTYVIPVKMVSQTGFGRILTGKLKEGGQEIRTDASQWEVQPMDYVLYCVKYQNKYSGYWLTNGNTSTDNIEKATEVKVSCRSLRESVYTVSYQKTFEARTFDANGNEVRKSETRVFTADLLLSFDANDQCTITSLTAGATAAGTGSWADDAEKKSWNNKDRDLMELDYTVDFGVDDYGNAIKGATHEKLVWYRSGVKTEEFSPIYNK